MLTTGVTKQIPIPNEPGQYATVKMLSGTQLRNAREARAAKAMEKAKAMGGDLLVALRSAPDVETFAASAGIPVAEPDPADTYDIDSILRAGLTGWSYPAVLTPDAISDQDEAWQNHVFREIVAFSKPPTQDELKNSSGGSI